MEPRLVVFTDNGQLSQLLICAEGEVLFEVPGNRLIDGIIVLMAVYLVFNSAYPKQYRQTLYFFEDILMGWAANKSDPTKDRPSRYNQFLCRFTF